MCDCTSGWIVAEIEGARQVVDRCMICNEPPWYRERRRRAALERWWPLLFVAFIVSAQVVLWTAAAFFG